MVGARSFRLGGRRSDVIQLGWEDGHPFAPATQPFDTTVDRLLGICRRQNIRNDSVCAEAFQFSFRLQNQPMPQHGYGSRLHIIRQQKVASIAGSIPLGYQQKASRRTW